MHHDFLDDGFRDSHADILAERECAARNMGAVAAYLTSIEALAREERNVTGMVSEETREALNGAGADHVHAIGWLLETNRQLFIAEQ